MLLPAERGSVHLQSNRIQQTLWRGETALDGLLRTFTFNLYCHLLRPNAGRLLHGEQTLQSHFRRDLLLGWHEGGKGGQVLHVVILWKREPISRSEP